MWYFAWIILGLGSGAGVRHHQCDVAGCPATFGYFDEEITRRRFGERVPRR